MRKLHKDKILELVNTLDMAYGELNKQKGQKFITLCGEMQSFVSSIFEYCEKILGEEHEILGLLKDLYEKLYYISQGNADMKEIQTLVRSIKEMAINLKPDKIEVAFLCYKASMSDALESIYFAAKEDPSCDAYFIPIPYFDRNPDGSFSNVHFDGIGCYSDKYELTDWEKYDIEARRPDAIFIMNPYDDQNYVTSVHPNFYSSRLKELTDMLVYVEYGLPYWIYRDHSQKEVLETFKNAIIAPGYLNASYCISYSKELSEGNKLLLKTHYPNMEKIEEKYIALGSSKFDKIINTTRRDYTLSESWEKRIGNKKIILYNTSLAELLKSSSQQSESMGEYLVKDSWYFKKLRSIINAFKNRNDVILWWRPHPLFESTLRSMRPSLFKEYMFIVEEFHKRNIGIFDDTEDLNRAIAFSDGMISDESSLLLLYTATGKPFYIPSITKALPYPVVDSGEDFNPILNYRLNNMRGKKGANVWNWNTCIWWDVFLEEATLCNTHYANFENRFIDFIVHQADYPEAEEYKQLQLQMIKDFVVNPDGTSGQKIYEFIKQKTFN